MEFGSLNSLGRKRWQHYINGLCLPGRETIGALACWQMYISISSPGNWRPLEFQSNILVAEIVLTTLITCINYSTTFVKVIWNINWLLNGKLYVEGAVDGVMCVCNSALSHSLVWLFLFLGEVCAKESAFGSKRFSSELALLHSWFLWNLTMKIH